MDDCRGLDTQRLYHRVIEIANIFVKEQAHLTIEALQDFDPSVEEFAETVKRIAKLIETFASEDDYSDQNIAINAHQCSIELGQLATAINRSDQTEVNRIIGELAKYEKDPY